MSFYNPWLLLTAAPFLLLFFFLKKLEKRRYADIPTQTIVKKIGRLKKTAKTAGRITWISAALLLVVVLARPQDIIEGDKFGVLGRKLILSIDLSQSMSGSGYSKTGQPSIEVTKKLSLEFVGKRATTDLVGITAYAGLSFGRRYGKAAVILFPTFEYEQLKASIELLRPSMEGLGIFTSIGEGIFLSILSLLEHSVLQEIDIDELAGSIESENHDYALNLVKKIGRLQNCVIVLFTDGKNNAGIEPKYPLWLAKILGIKVYFVALESTGATGLSETEESRQKNLLIEGVLATGGKYYESGTVEQIEEFYNDVDKIERANLEVSNFEKRRNIFFWPTMIALILLVVGITLENTFPRIQYGRRKKK